MPLNSFIVSSRIETVAPDLETASLLSRQPREGGFVAYAWQAREFPTTQDAAMHGDRTLSKRKKKIQLIRQGQTVDPKEKDEIAVQGTGPGNSPTQWSIWTIEHLDFQFDRQVIDVDVVFSVNVVPLSLFPTTLPNGKFFKVYSLQLRATGGYGSPYGYAVTSGSLPTGLQMDSNGLITGVPIIDGQTSQFTVTVTDAIGQTATFVLSITVGSSVPLSPGKPTIVAPLVDVDQNLMPGSYISSKSPFVTPITPTFFPVVVSASSESMERADPSFSGYALSIWRRIAVAAAPALPATRSVLTVAEALDRSGPGSVLFYRSQIGVVSATMPWRPLVPVWSEPMDWAGPGAATHSRMRTLGAPPVTVRPHASRLISAESMESSPPSLWQTPPPIPVSLLQLPPPVSFTPPSQPPAQPNWDPFTPPLGNSVVNYTGPAQTVLSGSKIIFGTNFFAEPGNVLAVTSGTGAGQSAQIVQVDVLNSGPPSFSFVGLLLTLDHALSPVPDGTSQFQVNGHALGAPDIAAMTPIQVPDGGIVIAGNGVSNDTTVQVWGQNTAGNGALNFAAVAPALPHISANVVTTVMPAAAVPNSAYLVWLNNSFGYGEPQWVNKTDFRWLPSTPSTMGFQTNSLGFAGDTCRLLGYNMTRAVLSGSARTVVSSGNVAFAVPPSGLTVTNGAKCVAVAYGMGGDQVLASDVVTDGSTPVIQSNTAGFFLGMVGQELLLSGGTAGLPAALYTILSFTDSQHVTISGVPAAGMGATIQKARQAGADFMDGTVNSYSGTTLTIAVNASTGSGTWLGWEIYLVDNVWVLLDAANGVKTVSDAVTAGNNVVTSGSSTFTSAMAANGSAVYLSGGSASLPGVWYLIAGFTDAHTITVKNVDGSAASIAAGTGATLSSGQYVPATYADPYRVEFTMPTGYLAPVVSGTSTINIATLTIGGTVTFGSLSAASNYPLGSMCRVMTNNGNQFVEGTVLSTTLTSVTLTITNKNGGNTNGVNKWYLSAGWQVWVHSGRGGTLGWSSGLNPAGSFSSSPRDGPVVLFNSAAYPYTGAATATVNPPVTANGTITGATNATPITITSANSLTNGATIYVQNILGSFSVVDADTTTVGPIGPVNTGAFPRVTHIKCATSTPFTAAMVGKFINLSGGTGSIPPTTWPRIKLFVSSSEVGIDQVVPSGTGATLNFGHAANDKPWVVVNATSTSFQLTGSVGDYNYSSGGTWNQTDHQQIQAALTAVGIGGKVVLGSVGTYTFDGPLTVAILGAGNNSIWMQGQGRGQTILRPSPSFKSASNVFIGNNNGKLSDFSLIFDDETHTSPIAGTSVSALAAAPASIVNVELKTLQYYVLNSINHAFNCKLTGGVSTSPACSLNFGGVVDSCQFYLTNRSSGCISVSPVAANATNGCLLIGNTFQEYNLALGQAGVGDRCIEFFPPSLNTWMLRNTSIALGPLNPGDNVGEQIVWDGSVIRGPYPVVAATATTVTFTDGTQPGPPFGPTQTMTLLPPCLVTVVGGTGTGYTGVCTAKSGSGSVTLTVDRPFKVPLNTTSIINVAQGGTDNVINMSRQQGTGVLTNPGAILNNMITGHPTAISTFTGQNNLVVDHCSFDGFQNGVTLWSYNFFGNGATATEVNYWTVLRNVSITGSTVGIYNTDDGPFASSGWEQYTYLGCTASNVSVTGTPAYPSYESCVSQVTNVAGMEGILYDHFYGTDATAGVYRQRDVTSGTVVDVLYKCTFTVGAGANPLHLIGAGAPYFTTETWYDSIGYISAPSPPGPAYGHTGSPTGPQGGHHGGGFVDTFIQTTFQGYNSNNLAPANPVPTLLSISPNSKPAGSPAFTMTLTGVNFILASVVKWNGSPLVTTFVNSSTLQAAVPAGNMSLAGASYPVTVFNPSPGGGTSASQPFYVLTSLLASPPFAFAVPGNNSVDVSWHTNAGASLYRVYRSTTTPPAIIPANRVGGDFATAQSATPFTDAAATNGTTYYYAVTSVDANGVETTGSPCEALLWPLPTVVKYVTGAADNGLGSHVIRLTLNNTTGMSTGDAVNVSSVQGTTEANSVAGSTGPSSSGAWLMTLIDGTHIDLQGSAFVHPYTGNGNVVDLTTHGVITGAPTGITPSAAFASSIYLQANNMWFDFGEVSNASSRVYRLDARYGHLVGEQLNSPLMPSRTVPADGSPIAGRIGLDCTINNYLASFEANGVGGTAECSWLWWAYFELATSTGASWILDLSGTWTQFRMQLDTVHFLLQYSDTLNNVQTLTCNAAAGSTPPTLNFGNGPASRYFFAAGYKKSTDQIVAYLYDPNGAFYSWTWSGIHINPHPDSLFQVSDSTRPLAGYMYQAGCARKEFSQADLDWLYNASSGKAQLRSYSSVRHVPPLDPGVPPAVGYKTIKANLAVTSDKDISSLSYSNGSYGGFPLNLENGGFNYIKAWPIYLMNPAFSASIGWKYAWLFSVQHGPGGIALGYSNDPGIRPGNAVSGQTSAWTVLANANGPLQNTSSGTYPETNVSNGSTIGWPWLVWNPDASPSGLWHLYHTSKTQSPPGGAINAEMNYVWTSPDLVTFSNQGNPATQYCDVDLNIIHGSRVYRTGPNAWVVHNAYTDSNSQRFSSVQVIAYQVGTDGLNFPITGSFYTHPPTKNVYFIYGTYYSRQDYPGYGYVEGLFFGEQFTANGNTYTVGVDGRSPFTSYDQNSAEYLSVNQLAVDNRSGTNVMALNLSPSWRLPGGLYPGPFPDDHNGVPPGGISNGGGLSQSSHYVQSTQFIQRNDGIAIGYLEKGFFNFRFIGVAPYGAIEWADLVVFYPNDPAQLFAANTAVPAGVMATNSGNASVIVSCLDFLPHQRYRVYRSTTSITGPWTHLADFTGLSYTDTPGALTPVWYYLTSRADTNSFPSVESNPSNAVPGFLVPAPTGLVATPGSGTVSLTWSNVGGATGYNVYQYKTSGTPISNSNTPVVSVGVNHATVSASGTWFYVVAATAPSGSPSITFVSGPSNEVSATT